MRYVIDPATTALPYPYLERAAAGLRAELRHLLLDDGFKDPPDSPRAAGDGPVEFTDDNGRTWFAYRATVERSDSATT